MEVGFVGSVVAVRRNAVVMRTGGPSGGKRFSVGGFGRKPVFRGGNKGSSGGDQDVGGRGGSDGRRGGPRGAGDAGSEGGAENPLMALWAGYNAMLTSKPILTKALTSVIGFSLGDILAQKFINKDGEFDTKRLLKMATFGFMFHGPTGHYFYGTVFANWQPPCPPPNPIHPPSTGSGHVDTSDTIAPAGFLDRLIVGTQAWKVAAKVAIDQVLWAPIFTLCFFAFLGIADGQSFDEIKKKVESDLVAGVTASWKVWPVVHAINFRFIPTSQRLLYINSIQILYNVFLSFIGNKKPSAA